MNMKHFLIVGLFMALTGCAAQQQTGSFVPNWPYSQSVADDTIKQMGILFPPASTRLEFAQVEKRDSYGKALISGLRTAGYAVAEVPAASRPGAGAGRIEYVLDQPEGTNIYRLVLKIGPSATLTRPYVVATNDRLYPAGAWLFRED